MNEDQKADEVDQEMLPHQKRVVQEKAELDEKVAKLDAFIAESETFKGLPADEKKRLLRQLVYMESYSAILAQRIAAF
jgi:hypothetical protein